MLIKSLTGKNEKIVKLVGGQKLKVTITPEGTDVPDELGEKLAKGHDKFDAVSANEAEINEPETDLEIIEDLETPGEETVEEKQPFTREELEDEEKYPREKLISILQESGANPHPNTGRAKLIDKILGE
jgi:hypothetical protein